MLDQFQKMRIFKKKKNNVFYFFYIWFHPGIHFFKNRTFLEPAPNIFLEPEYPFFLLELETAKFPQVINMAKIGRTEMLYPVLGSIFSEFSHSDDHFAIALQKTSVFNEKLYL